MSIKDQISEWIKINGIETLPKELQYDIKKGILNPAIVRYFDELFYEIEKQAKEQEERKWLYERIGNYAEMESEDEDLDEFDKFCLECGEKMELDTLLRKYCSTVCARDGKNRKHKQRLKDGHYEEYAKTRRKLTNSYYKNINKKKNKTTIKTENNTIKIMPDTIKTENNTTKIMPDTKPQLSIKEQLEIKTIVNSAVHTLMPAFETQDGELFNASLYDVEKLITELCLNYKAKGITAGIKTENSRKN